MAQPTLRHLLAFSIIASAFTCARAALPAGTADELLKQLRKDVPDVLDCEPEHGLPFTVQEIQLAAEGSPQYLLTSTHDCMCGQVNCSEWVYRRGPQKWELILETQGYLFKPRAAAHHGYRDVETRSRDNAVRVDTLVYVFDGHVYRPAGARKSDAQAGAIGRTHSVRFAAGTSSIQLQGSASLDDTERWRLGARKAQTLRLVLVDHENAGIGFTLLGPPGFIAQTRTASGSGWEITLPVSGTYTVLVDSQRKGSATYTLSIYVR